MISDIFAILRRANGGTRNDRKLSAIMVRQVNDDGEEQMIVIRGSEAVN